MDPVTIVGLVGAATKLTFICGKIIRDLHDLTKKYNDTNTTLGNILLECTSLDAAVTLIKEWIEGSLSVYKEVLPNSTRPSSASKSP
jgi:hypothetical protein